LKREPQPPLIQRDGDAVYLVDEAGVTWRVEDAEVRSDGAIVPFSGRLGPLRVFMAEGQRPRAVQLAVSADHGMTAEVLAEQMRTPSRSPLRDWTQRLSCGAPRRSRFAGSDEPRPRGPRGMRGANRDRAVTQMRVELE
jgi:hypothetical protein